MNIQKNLLTEIERTLINYGKSLEDIKHITTSLGSVKFTNGYKTFFNVMYEKSSEIDPNLKIYGDNWVLRIVPDGEKHCWKYSQATSTDSRSELGKQFSPKINK